MAYITKNEVENYLGITIQSTVSAYINTLISACSDHIERMAGGGIFERRQFEVANGDSTKHYDGNDSTKLEIDDLRTITSLVVDGVSLTENDDYYLYPLNETVKTRIELLQPETRLSSNSRIGSVSPYIFDKGQRTIAVTGQFGYSETPPDVVKLACMKLVGAVIKENIGDTDLREMTQESLGDYSASFTRIKDIAERLDLKALLGTYVRTSVKPSVGQTKIS